MMIKFVADIGSNHNQDWTRAAQLIDVAKFIGCDAVKFQYFKADLLYAPEFKKQIEQNKLRELPDKFLPKIRDLCDKIGVKFWCTVFHRNDVAICARIANMLKIGSYELLYRPLLEAVVYACKPWTFSAGMASIEQISDCVAFGMTRHSMPKYVFHCNSNYPARPEHCNLGRIVALKNMFEILRYERPQIGWSDHTGNEGLVLGAISCGAQIVEFHLDLEDCCGAEYIHGHCWTPEKAQRMIRRARYIEKIRAEYPKYEPDWYISETTNEEECSKWRMDSIDGQRPLSKYRWSLYAKECLPDES